LSIVPAYGFALGRGGILSRLENFVSTKADHVYLPYRVGIEAVIVFDMAAD
jgi:hypothetical protein